MSNKSKLSKQHLHLLSGSMIRIAGLARKKQHHDKALQKVLSAQFGRAFLLIVSISFVIAFTISWYSASLINENGRQRSIETFAKSVEPLLARYDIGDIDNLLMNAREINGLADIRLMDRYGRVYGGINGESGQIPPDLVVPLNYDSLGKIGDVQVWWADDRSLLLLLVIFIAVWAAQMLTAWILSALFLRRVLNRHVVDPLTTLQDQVNFLENNGSRQELDKFEVREFNNLSNALGEAWDAARESSEITKKAYIRTEREMRHRLAITHVVENALKQAKMSILFSTEEGSEVTRLGHVESDAVDLVLPCRDDPPEAIEKLLSERGYSVTVILDNPSQSNDSKNQKVFTLEVENSSSTVWTITYISLENKGYALISIDITEQKEVYKALQQSLKLEAMGSLTSGVAHDFNNILAIISGALEMALLDETDRSHLKKAKFASIRGTALVRQLLSVSRNEQQKLSPVDLSAAIKNIAHVFPASLGSDHRLSIASFTDKFAMAEAETFETSLINLVMNARAAMEKGGEIRIIHREVDKKEVLHAGLSTDIEYLAVDVIDEGEGIADEIQSRIFDPFFTTKKIGSGTGLGLSMVDGFATRSGGKVVCSSSVNYGSRFTIYLPVAQINDASEVPHTENQNQEPKGEENRNILIVDDEAPLSQILSEFLGHHGFSIDVAEDYDEAANLYDTQSEGAYDIILVDMYMPGGTGLDLLQRTRELDQPPFRILMSGNVHEESLTDEEKACCDYIVQKPFSLKDLLGVIENQRIQ